MNKLGHEQSQILKETQASFLGSASLGGKTSKAAPDRKSPSAAARKQLIDSSHSDGLAPLKSWEEPPPSRPTVNRKVSYVRLPGPYLTDEEEDEFLLEKAIRSKEIINYLKEKWDLELDKKSSLIDIQFRTVELLLHQLPPNHWLLKRARQKIAEHTGYFSNVTKPYECLGIPETDDDMLLFHNLPGQIKIDTEEWTEVMLKREQDKQKANARLPHVPHRKSKRTTYSRGRIKQEAGGMQHVEKLIANGDAFQRKTRGAMTFMKLLERWSLEKDEEMANRGSPFGLIKRTNVQEIQQDLPDLTGNRGNAYERDDSGKIVNAMDESKFQEYLNLEQMIMAIFYLVQSVINIKAKQLKCKSRIPHSGVMELRYGSAQSVQRKRLPQLHKLLDTFNKNTGFYSAFSRGVTGQSTESYDSSGLPITSSSYGLDSDKSDYYGDPSLLGFKDTGREVMEPFNTVTAAEIYALSDASSEEDMKTAVERVRGIMESPSYLDDRPFELRSKNLRKERPVAQAERNWRHYNRFRVMFRRHEEIPQPIWMDVSIKNYKKLSADERSDSTSMTMRRMSSAGSGLERSSKIPDEDDMLTPTLPGPSSISNLSSEEQSRLNLFSIVPEGTTMDTGPSSPLRNLYQSAGVQVLDKDLLHILNGIKRPFRELEKSLRVNVTNKVEKYEWDTQKRYNAKIKADVSNLIYERAIGNMRNIAKMAARAEQREIEMSEEQTDISQKKPASWFRDLIEVCDRIGALKHQGVSENVHKLLRYCDVHSNSRPQMLNRFALLVVSLPANELASPHFQKAIVFLLDRLFGSPTELLQEWLQYRGLKPLIK